MKNSLIEATLPLAESQPRLPNRQLLQAKLHEFYSLTGASEPDETNMQGNLDTP